MNKKEWMKASCVPFQPGPPASHQDREPPTPQRPKTDDRSSSETHRFPLFDREPFRPVTEFFPQFDIKDPINHVVVTGAIGPAGPTLRAPSEEKTPTPFPPPLLPPDTDTSGSSRELEEQIGGWRNGRFRC